MVKVLLATNEEQLDNAILSEPNIEGVSNPIYYREAVVQMAQKSKPDVVVLTAWLTGTTDIVDIVYELRSMDIRVVFLAGTLEQSDPIVQDVAKLGVYDILFREVTIGHVIDKIHHPTPASKGIPLIDGREQNQAKHEGDKKNSREKVKAQPEETGQENKKAKGNPFQKLLRTSEKFKVGFSLPKLPKNHNKNDNKAVLYIPHHIISVWSPAGGILKSLTALNLAVTAAQKGFSTALINYDLTCPVLDKWFKIPNTSLNELQDGRGAGIMTFGPDLKPEVAEKMLLNYGWNIKYLPAGNKLGNIGTPDIPLETLEKVIQSVYRRQVDGKPAITIIDTSPIFEMPTTYAALKNSSILILPTSGDKLEREVINDQLKELERLDLKLQSYIVNWGNKNSQAQFNVPYSHEKLTNSANSKRPYCLLLGNNPFETILSNILN